MVNGAHKASGLEKGGVLVEPKLLDHFEHSYEAQMLGVWTTWLNVSFTSSKHLAERIDVLISLRSVTLESSYTYSAYYSFLASLRYILHPQT